MSTMMSKKLREFFDVKPSEEKQFFKSHPNIGKLTADYASGWTSLAFDKEASEDFLDTFGVHPLSMSSALKAGATMKQLLDKKKDYPDHDLECIVDSVMDDILYTLDDFDDEDDSNNELIFTEDGDVISVSTVMDILRVSEFSSVRAESVCRAMYDCSPGDPITINYKESQDIFPAMIDDTMLDVSTGIVTILLSTQEGGESLSLSSSFTIDREQETVDFEYAMAPLVLENSVISGSNGVFIVRGFNGKESIDITYPGGKYITIPRKFLAAWRRTEDVMFHGISAEALSDMHSVDSDTGEMIVPEEGVDFLSSGNYQ